MKLLWLDLETTGLDPQKDQILEVAACVADLERPFDVRDPFEAVLRPPVKPLDGRAEAADCRRSGPAQAGRSFSCGSVD